MKRKTYSKDFKRKAVELSNETSNLNAAKELGVSASTISRWRSTFRQASIQNTEGNLNFSLNNCTYALNVNSEEERNTILAKINSNSEYSWDWFKEETGKNHWVLYCIDMYNVETRSEFKYLHYRELSGLVPIIPINASSCYNMFCACNRITRLDLSQFNTSEIITMFGMFDSCYSLTKLDLSTFDTSNVMDMSFMFIDCHALKALDVTSFSTDNVTTMRKMFYGCRNLRVLELSNFNTSNVTVFYGMFAHCANLNNLDISNFDFSNAEDVSFMFCCCRNLMDIQGFTIDAVEMVPKHAMFYGCDKIDLY